MDLSQPTRGTRQQRSRRRTLLTLRTIRSLFQRIQEGVRSRLHLPLPTTTPIEDAPRDITGDFDPVVSGLSSPNLSSSPIQQPFAVGTFVMSSSRNTRRATGQLRRFDESPLDYAIRRSRRVAGEAPETGPYQPPPRRPPRQEAAYSRHLAQSETTPHPPPPSSTFTFSRLDPPVPYPGFSSVRLSSTNTPHGPAQPSHVHSSLQSFMTHPVDPRQAATSDAHLQGLSSVQPPVKVEDLPPPKVDHIKRECEICCEADEAPVLQPCRLCPTSYCGDCIRSLFLDATRDSTSMPPRCCTILSTRVALDFLSTAEADAYRLKFEEWASTKKTYCPVPKCSRFIPDRAVLSPPSADPVTLWSLVKRELPAILTKLQQEPCAKYFMDATSAAHAIRDWKYSSRMVWLSDISAKISRYSNMAEFVIDFNRLYSSGRHMSPAASTSAEVLRRHLWKEIGKIKTQANSRFTVLPAAACFSCPGCHIGICPSCKQVAHSGQPCDTAAQDHELAMLETYGYKKCPRCGHGVKRMYGCRHMQCRCGAHWCWGCLRPLDECDGGCDSPDSGSEDGDYSDEELDPALPQPNVIPPRAQDVEQSATTIVHPPAVASAPDNVSATARQPTTALVETIRLGLTERPIDLDTGGRRVWEASGAFFGEEPDDGYHSTIWSCLHVFKPAQLSEEAFKRGVPLSTECFRCFYRTYATVKKSAPDHSSKSKDSAENKHKHTAEEDVAWQCDFCEMSLCGVCKNDVMSERGL